MVYVKCYKEEKLTCESSTDSIEKNWWSPERGKTTLFWYIYILSDIHIAKLSGMSNCLYVFLRYRSLWPTVGFYVQTVFSDCTANEGPVRRESNINVYFPFMYSQKWNCAASLFPKQNYNVLSPNSYTQISVRYLYISRIGLSIWLQPNMWTDHRTWNYINRSQTHKCGNWNWGRTIPRKRIHKWDFRCSVGREMTYSLFLWALAFLYNTV